MTDSDTEHHMKTIHFHEADTSQERVAAVLVTRSADGALCAYVKDYPNRRQPDPEAVAMLVQSVELNNMEDMQ